MALPAPPDVALANELIDATARDHSVERFREAGIRLPTFAELTDPSSISPDIVAGLSDVDPDVPAPENLFRVHWFNGVAGTPPDEGFTDTPAYIELPSELTGVNARIILA